MMNRRKFIQKSSYLTLPMMLNGIPLSAVSKHQIYNAIDEDNDHVLVLIQLNGGNDGLNTIIPLDKYDILGNYRRNILIPENRVIGLEKDFGLHPSMSGIKEIYDSGQLNIIQDVGYPNQNRSHFRSLDIWQTGSSAEDFITTGWIGRYFENRHPSFPDDYPNQEYNDPFAITIGNSLSETCQGTGSNFSLALTDPDSLTPLSGGGVGELPDSPYGRELEFIRTSIEQSNAYGGVIKSAASLGSNLSGLYNDDRLSNQLKTIAQLISGGLKTKVYVANLGGFDTHASQVSEGSPSEGEHATLLESLSQGMRAFQDDINQLGLGQKVITMTFSEFGRRIRSNDSLGTDHGTAAPILVSGSCINPGLIGSSPDLPDQPQSHDGVQMQYDFRDVYGSILVDWFGIELGEAKSILHENFVKIPIIKNCNTTTSTQELEGQTLDLSSFPNPCRDWTKVTFNSDGRRYRLSLFDGYGREVKVITDQQIPNGPIDLSIETYDLPSGNYYLRLVSSHLVTTKSFVKL